MFKKCVVAVNGLGKQIAEFAEEHFSKPLGLDLEILVPLAMLIVLCVVLPVVIFVCPLWWGKLTFGVMFLVSLFIFCNILVEEKGWK